VLVAQLLVDRAQVEVQLACMLRLELDGLSSSTTKQRKRR
jgi:hypothetical protein